MSTLAVGTIKSISSAAPVFQNTSGTEKGQLVKAWVNFNGTGTVAIRDSFNVSSITDVSTGIYTVTFTNAMANDDYVTLANNRLSETGGSTSTDHVLTSLVNTTQSTTAVSIYNREGSTLYDCNSTQAAVFGDN